MPVETVQFGTHTSKWHS